MPSLLLHEPGKPELRQRLELPGAYWALRFKRGICRFMGWLGANASTGCKGLTPPAKRLKQETHEMRPMTYECSPSVTVDNCLRCCSVMAWLHCSACRLPFVRLQYIPHPSNGFVIDCRYVLDLSRPYCRSLLRILYKTAERCKIPLEKAQQLLMEPLLSGTLVSPLSSQHS